MSFPGVITALATPFKNGEVDYPSLKKLIRFQLDEGIQGFVINGTTAESPTLSSAEKKDLFHFVKSESGGAVPLIMGTGSNNTQATVEATKAAENWGADGALVVVPYYNKPTQRGLLAHFKTVAENTRLPIMLYNVPARTVTSLETSTVKELSTVDNIVAIKEATGDAGVTKEIVAACGRDFQVSSGDDGAYLEVYSAGGQGVVSVLSHLIPRWMRAWAEDLHDDEVRIKGEFSKFENLVRLLFIEANPAPVKYALYLMGIFETPEVRLPLVTLSENYQEELKKELELKGLI